MPEHGLAARYAPTQWSEVVGQGHVTAILAAVAISEHRPPFIVLSGPSGVGKSAVAGIFGVQVTGRPPESLSAVLLNDQNARISVISRMYGPDPAVWVLEEAAALSEWADMFRVFDDPPKKATIVLVTARFEELPPLIRTRSLHLALRRLKSEDMQAKIDEICDSAPLDVSTAARMRVVEAAAGSLRDAYMCLEQVLWLTDGGPVLPVHVNEVLGAADERTLYALLEGILLGDVQVLERAADHAHMLGVDIDRFFLDMQALLALCLRFKAGAALPIDTPDERRRYIMSLAGKVGLDQLRDTLQALWTLHARLQTQGPAAYAALLTGLLLLTRIQPARPEPLPGPRSAPITAERLLALFEQATTT